MPAPDPGSWLFGEDSCTEAEGVVETEPGEVITDGKDGETEEGMNITELDDGSDMVKAAEVVWGSPWQLCLRRQGFCLEWWKACLQLLQIECFELDRNLFKQWGHETELSVIWVLEGLRETSHKLEFKFLIAYSLFLASNLNLSMITLSTNHRAALPWICTFCCVWWR